MSDLKDNAEKIISEEGSRVDAQKSLFDDKEKGASDRLRLYVERVERLLEEKSGLQDDIKDIFAEVKSAGFDTKALRRVISLRAMDSQKRAEQEELVDLYSVALGLV